MLGSAFGFLALFSILSILLGGDDRRRPADDIWVWTRYGQR
jgi:hypothetical protein